MGMFVSITATEYRVASSQRPVDPIVGGGE